MILIEKKLLELFTEKDCKNCKKQIKYRLKFKKVIKRNGDKKYIKWKDYGGSFNSWIDKKDTL